MRLGRVVLVEVALAARPDRGPQRAGELLERLEVVEDHRAVDEILRAQLADVHRREDPAIDRADALLLAELREVADRDLAGVDRDDVRPVAGEEERRLAATTADVDDRAALDVAEVLERVLEVGVRGTRLADARPWSPPLENRLSQNSTAVMPPRSALAWPSLR